MVVSWVGVDSRMGWMWLGIGWCLAWSWLVVGLPSVRLWFVYGSPMGEVCTRYVREKYGESTEEGAC